MPSMPSLDIVGVFQLFSLMLVSLGIIWGINKAIQLAKDY